MQTVDVNLFKDTVMCNLAFSQWTNRRKVKIKDASTIGDGKVTFNVSGATDDQPPVEGATPAPGRKEKVDKQRVSVVKQLLISPELENIKAHMAETRNMFKARTNPSFFAKGINVVRSSLAESIDQMITERKKVLKEELVPAFLETYEMRKVETASKISSVLFDPLDYPPSGQLELVFDIRWNWIAIGVPESLPRELFELEKQKAEQQWADAGQQIMLALRVGWQQLTDHLLERLTVQPGEKPKVFRDTAIGNIKEFIQTFNDRNITNDSELEQLIGKAREIIGDVSPDELRKSEEVRTYVKANFEQIKAAVDRMVIDMPSRAMDFDDGGAE